MYQIVRFRQGQGREIIKQGLSLEQAQEHCTNDTTHGVDWFDGYEKEI